MFFRKTFIECNEWVQIEFRIKDTESVKMRISELFAQFKQLDMDKNKGIEGTGLGLPL